MLITEGCMMIKKLKSSLLSQISSQTTSINKSAERQAEKACLSCFERVFCDRFSFAKDTYFNFTIGLQVLSIGILHKVFDPEIPDFVQYFL
jgi:hypothetical protein